MDYPPGLIDIVYWLNSDIAGSQSFPHHSDRIIGLAGVIFLAVDRIGVAEFPERVGFG
jgi:hypothetical protein